MLNQNQATLVPLEEISLPLALDGSQGKNRSYESSLLSAQNEMAPRLNNAAEVIFHNENSFIRPGYCYLYTAQLLLRQNPGQA